MRERARYRRGGSNHSLFALGLPQEESVMRIRPEMTEEAEDDELLSLLELLESELLSVLLVEVVSAVGVDFLVEVEWCVVEVEWAVELEAWWDGEKPERCAWMEKGRVGTHGGGGADLAASAGRAPFDGVAGDVVMAGAEAGEAVVGGVDVGCGGENKEERSGQLH